LVVDEFGFDAAIDYRGEDIRKALRTHAPDGVDVYFDNVGGDVLDAVLPRLARGARVIVCGAVSQYNSTEPKGPANYLSLLVNRATMTGMVVFDYADRYAEGVARLAAWRAEGRLTSMEDVATGGVAAFPDTLMRLFRGENRGKLVLKIAD
ncbi:zinc-binding dehydrogenase, partial [Streptomyces sp. NPDC059374]